MLGLNFFGRKKDQALKAPQSHVEPTLDMQAAVQLPTVDAPKVKKQPQGLPSYLKTAGKTSAPLTPTDRRLATTDVLSYRSGANTQTVVRDFAAASPDLAAAIFTYLRTSITDGYTAVAQNMDGTFNVDATNVLQQIIRRMDVLPTYKDGFAGSYSLLSNSEALGKELLLYGACAGELVLDKSLTPWRIQPIHVPQIEFVPEGNSLKPRQKVVGQTIELDIPTFFYTSLDQDLLSAYASSPLEPAIRPTMFSEDFVQDLWKVVKKAVHPRETVTIDWDKLKLLVPPEAQHDPNKLNEWMQSIIDEVTSKVSGLQPDEALVLFDFIKVERENNGNSSLSSEWDTLHKIANAKLASGAKTLPGVLGHGNGTSNTASTEAMLYVKSATGALQLKLNEFYSRAFTLAVRLYGFDVTVTFKYNPIDLRPETELESFKSQKQSRILELLSYGFYTDEEASLQLTGKLPPKGFTPLSGTRFTVTKADTGNPYNGETNNGSTLNQNLGSDAPAGGARGSNTKTGGVKADASVVPFSR